MQILFVITYAQLDPFKYKQVKNISTAHAAVVSAHPLASEAGLNILKQGGNAIDAAITTQLVLAVVYPGAGNIGGGGFLVAHLKNGKNITIDYREKAPGNASKNMFLDSAGEPIKKLSLESALAAGVPGTVAGLFASMKYARLDFKKLINPAILLAEKGFAITAAQADTFNNKRKVFLKANRNAIAFVKDGLWKAGDTLIQKQLAVTLKRIRDKGKDGFYKGETARLIVDEMRSGNGIINYNDLEAYRAKEREPMVFQYKGTKVITMPLPSSGGIILQQMLKMIEHRKVPLQGLQSSDNVQLMVEAERRAFADRAFYLGDPDFVKVPVKQLVSKAYLQQRISDFKPGIAGKSDIIKEGKVHESEQTTHISIIDKEGNAVSVTTTLNDSYGSKTIVSGAGFLLNNEMDDFSVKEGAPNFYGAVGNAENAIAPNKRMLSSMTPTIVLKNNLPYIVVGSPGGTTIPTSVFQTLVNIIDFHVTPSEAVNLPKFHHQWLPDVVYFERDYPAKVLTDLTKMGYEIKLRDPIGRTELITITTDKKRLINAIADKRGDDGAAGY